MTLPPSGNDFQSLNGIDPRFAQMHLRTRRHFLGQTAMGIGSLALSAMLGESLARGASTAQATKAAVRAPGSALAPPPIAATAKCVIYLHMAGSPPQQDLLDPKPELEKWHGKDAPAELTDGERFAFIKGTPTILASPYGFTKQGESGIPVSELLPHFGSIVDDVTLVHSMHTDQFNHAPAQLFLYTGAPQLGRPSMGSWITYGLGSSAQNLPSFVVLVSGSKTPSAGKSVWGSGFLPSVHQGVQCRSSGDPILYLNDPPGMSRSDRRRTLDALRAMNTMAYSSSADPETLARIEQYELAFRMQIAAPEAMDIAREPESIRTMYGANPGTSSFANNCLLARRLIERGVRFVQLFDWGWDTHGTSKGDDIVNQLPKKCRETDRASSALIQDLKQRGLLDDTLVIWSGEFGRTAMNEARNGSTFLGRDHHPGCFSIWMAGGGIKAGHVHGSTGPFGTRINDGAVHVHDLQATILAALGLDHEKLTYRFQGRDFRLTDVHGKVVKELFARGR